jgi:diadenosine tetraphosphatase ApaH/serine/threonine PP2A family protein phosphatase
MVKRRIQIEQGFDVIGDVHGCVNTLQKLLNKMDYQKINGVFEHSTRQAVFLGDIIDRGPHIREALHLVREMVERGSARTVMGNHEYNAIGYCTRAHPGGKRLFLREHNPRNDRIIKETLEQFANYGPEWNDFLEWFRTMPLFIEEKHFRVVHACWDGKLIGQLRQIYPDGVINDDFIHASVVRKSFAGRVMDRLLRGTDMPLPTGVTITSEDGYVRSFFRTKFWAIDPQTYDDIVFQPDQLPASLQHRAISSAERARLVTYSQDEVPVFVGHYWLSGKPAPVRDNVGCLDYSAVKNGKLVAYRMDKNKCLHKDRFVWESVSAEARG